MTQKKDSHLQHGNTINQETINQETINQQTSNQKTVDEQTNFQQPIDHTFINLQQLDAFNLEHESEAIDQLIQFLRIPSVSAVPEHTNDMHKAADWLAQAMREAGLEHVKVMSSSGYPIVYGDWLHASGKPTVLVYGHYDVQPAEPLELWESPPFDPQIRDGKLYARGATDDKGQLYIHIKAVESYLKLFGQLPVNIKFCIEGEEEISSQSLPVFIEQNKEKLRSDVITCSDTSMYAENQPALMYSLRGLASLEVEIKGANTDLHSGLFGGGVPNPIHALTELLSTLHDKEGRVTIPGFYADIIEPTEKEKESFHFFSQNEIQIRQQLELESLFGEVGYSFYEQTTARPTLEVTSISGGFQGDGIKPIVPSLAKAKIACRIVADQDPDQILDHLEAYLQQHKPPAVQLNVTRLVVGRPFLTSTEHPTMIAAGKAYEAVYGKWPLFTRGGGAIPIIELMNRTWQAPVVMLGFGLPNENLHAPNEHFHLANFRKGIQTVVRFWTYL
jgi:acetylornithine deacetylase/succinyl-diaminopimelate desuccinylase-like protein